MIERDRSPDRRSSVSAMTISPGTVMPSVETVHWASLNASSRHGRPLLSSVITSYSIHYTKLYEGSPDESLKIYSGFPRVELYEGTVRHELVHHVTSRMSGYNIPGWYAEGLAVHYGNSVTLGGDYVSLGRILAVDARLTIGELEAADQVRMTDDREVYAYYGASGLIVRYIEEAYGPDSHLRLLKRLGELPVITSYSIHYTKLYEDSSTNA